MFFLDFFTIAVEILNSSTIIVIICTYTGQVHPV